MSESPFEPASHTFFGDYTNVSAYHNVVQPVWTRLQNDQLSVWTALVETDSILSAIRPETRGVAFSIGRPYPNPFSDETEISFQLDRPAIVSMSIMDPLGNIVAMPMSQKWMDRGDHLENIASQASGLTSGYYFICIIIDGARTSPMIKVR